MQKFERIKEFPIIPDVRLAFSHYPEEFFNRILEQSKEVEGMSIWIARTERLFFGNKHFNLNKNLDKEYIIRGKRLFLAILNSYKPCFVYKIKVCAMILRSLEEKC